MSNAPAQNPWLARYAAFTAACTLALIAIGGLVTSKGAGMAVPDWPTTYGYNMFLFPISQWQGGIFYEHSHRLFASYVGLLTVILTVWLWFQAGPLRKLGVAALCLVVVQGLLGGLRVTQFADKIGIFHAILAQLFLVLLSLVAMACQSWFQRLTPEGSQAVAAARWKPKVVTACLLILTQLALGASMRHQHAGLAVPDFPLAYGKAWPPSNPAFLESINQKRVDSRDFKPVTAGQIHLHMTHRVLAFAILGYVGVLAVRARKDASLPRLVQKWMFAWKGLLCVQLLLGAVTVWTNKAADMATLHVVTGAVSLVCGACLAGVLWKLSAHESGHRHAAENTSANRQSVALV